MVGLMQMVARDLESGALYDGRRPGQRASADNSDRGRTVAGQPTNAACLQPTTVETELPSRVRTDLYPPASKPVWMKPNAKRFEPKGLTLATRAVVTAIDLVRWQLSMLGL